MALEDPTDPAGYFDPAIADALSAQSDPYGFEWPPPHWQNDGDPFAPPLPDQQIGGAMGVVENAAAPSIAGEEFDQIEMPPEDMRPVTTGQPRAPGVANLLGEPSYEDPPPPDLYHEGQFVQTGTDRPTAPRGPDPTPMPPGFVGNRPEKSAEELGLEYGQDPIKLMLAKQKYADEQQRFADESAASARIRDEMAAEANHQRQLDVQEKTRVDMESLNNEAIALSKTKVDPDRWYRNRSTTGKIGAWVAAIVGGLVSGRTGGPNTGLANIMKMIDDDVDAQKADLSNQQQSLGIRRGIVSDSYARSGDAFRSAEAFRMASYERVKADLMTQQSQFDPKSASAIKFGQMIQDVGARQAAARMAAEDRQLKVNTAAAEFHGKLLANEKARRALSGSGAARPNYTEAQLASPTPPAGWTKGTAAWLDVSNKYLTGRKSAQEINAGGKVGEEQRQQKLVRGGIGFVDYDENGKKVEFVPKGLDSEVTKLRDKKKGTTEMVNLLDEAMALRTGWTSDTVGSDENKQLKAIMGKLKLAAKKTEDLGAITEADADLIKGLIGTDDFTSWRGVDASVAQARRNLIGSLRIEAAGQGMSARGASEINFPNLWAEKAKVSQEEGAYQGLLGGKLDDNTKKQTLDAIAANAQSTDPKVNGPARARLRKLAADSPDELDRRSIANWLTLPQFGGGQQ